MIDDYNRILYIEGQKLKGHPENPIMIDPVKIKEDMEWEDQLNAQIAEAKAKQKAEREARKREIKQRETAVQKMTPRDIKHYLDRHVYGQDDAKIQAAVMLWKHVHGIRITGIMIGPSGSGKTEIWRTLKSLYPNISIEDASQITNVGFSGSQKAYTAIQGLIKQGVETGIVVYDEFDKLCEPRYARGGENVSHSVQSEMLKMIEGDDIRLRDKYDEPKVISTKAFSFVFMGAFERLMREKRSKKPTFGFKPSPIQEGGEENITIDPEDLIKYGIRNELMGRIGSITMLSELTEQDYYNIIMDKNFGIRKRIKEKYGYELKITQATARHIAREAKRSGMGVRYMWTLSDQVIDKYIYKGIDQDQELEWID